MKGSHPVDKARRWMAVDNPWPWLVYLSFYFIPWFFRTPSQEELIVSFIGVAIFLVVYFRSFRAKGSQLVLAVVAMTVIGLVLANYSVTASVFLIYAAAASANLRPGKLAAVTGLGVFLAMAVYSVLTQAHIFFWAPAVLFGVMTGFSVYMSRELLDSNIRLEASQGEARRLAAVAERERIARDLHDLLGHTLTVIAVKSELAGKVLDEDPERARKEIKDINQTTRQALADIRGAISGIKNLSLAGELASAKRALESADVSMEIHELEDKFPDEVGAALAMLVREGVTNVIRHAHADKCRIQVTADQSKATLIIEDDGRGGVSQEGHGIEGMRSRVAALSGTFEISGPPGTRITASIPLGAS